MNCREVKKLLGDYIAGSLDKNLKMSLQEHLKTCKGCASELVEPDLPGEDLDFEAEEKDEIDIPKTRVKSAPPAQEEADGIAAAETGEKPGEPELKNETGKAVFEPETELPGTDPGEYLEESVMEESADRSVSEETSGAGLALGKQLEYDGPVEVALLIKSSASSEPDVSVTARKKADAGFKEKSMQDDELTTRWQSHRSTRYLKTNTMRTSKARTYSLCPKKQQYLILPCTSTAPG